MIYDETYFDYVTAQFSETKTNRPCCWGEDEDCPVCHAIELVKKHRDIPICRKYPRKVVWWLSQEHNLQKQKFLVRLAYRLRFEKADGWCECDSLYDPKENWHVGYDSSCYNSGGAVYWHRYTDEGVQYIESHTF